MISSKQSDRNIYIQLLKMHKLPNVLGIIDEMPFSRKVRILKKLLLKFSNKEIIIGLNEYKRNYIDVDRVNIFSTEGILIGICKKIKEKGRE